MSKRLQIDRLIDSGALTLTQVYQIPVTDLVNPSNPLYSEEVYNALNTTQRLYDNTLNSLLLMVNYDTGVKKIVDNIVDAYELSVETERIQTLASEWDYKEVTLSSAQIIGLSSWTALIPDEDVVGDYLSEIHIDLEYTHNTTQFTPSGAGQYLRLLGSNNIEMYIDRGFLSTAQSSVCSDITATGQLDTTADISYYFPVDPSSSKGLWIKFNNFTVSGGDGTLLFKIKYKTKTIGTTL